MYNIYTKSEIGSSHIDKGIVCQDYSAGMEIESGICIAAVSDGHGSTQYIRSDRGAKFAVNAAMSCLAGFCEGFSDCDDERKLSISMLEDKDRHPELMHQLCKSIMYKWYEAIEYDFNRHPFAEKELEELDDKYRKKYLEGDYVSAYGATLIAVLITENYWLALQIGDGKLVCFDQSGHSQQPVPWDEECVSNITTSICQRDAADKFRYYIGSKPDLPAAVCFGSDGMDDTYGDGETLTALYSQFLLEFAKEGYDKTSHEIDELLPGISRTGSHDDISVALMFDVELIKRISEKLKRHVRKIKINDSLEKYEKDMKRANKKYNIALSKYNECLQRNTNSTELSIESEIYINEEFYPELSELEAEKDEAFRELEQMTNEYMELVSQLTEKDGGNE